MAAKNSITIAYKIEDADGGLRKVVADFDDFRQILQSAATEANKLNEEIINISDVAAKIETVNNCMGSLISVMSNLQQAYSAQVEVETQLAVNMRNTMGAREEEIQSIKDLCAAQQELGVIGDEVQLAGAQQLATYLGQKSSLEQLIPAMNDMIAQQYGLNVTQENAAQIASILGQVMEGQTGVLSRYGYSFNEVQEHILKYGTEAERAAVLTEVVESAVGGMNAELAKTDAGKQKQLENTLGNLKEQFGAIAQKILPVVTGLAQLTIAAGGVAKLCMTIKTVVSMMGGLHAKTRLAQAAMLLLTGSAQNAVARFNVFSTALTSSAHNITALKIAMNGLLRATAIGAVIWGITKAVQALTGASKEASDAQKTYQEEQSRLQQEYQDWKRNLTDLSQSVADSAAKEMSALERLYNVAKDDTKSRKERSDAIEELKRQWPDYFGQISSERIEVDKLTKSYEDAKNAIIDLATVKAIDAKLVENAGEKLNLETELSNTQKDYREFQAIYDAVKDLPKVDESTGGVKFGDVKEALAGKKYKGEDAFIALQSGKFNVDGVSVLRADDKSNGQQFINLHDAMDAMDNKYVDTFKDIAKRADDIDTANDELVSRSAEVSKRLKGNLKPTAPTTLPKQNDPVLREGATQLHDIEGNVKYYQAQLDTATVETASEINANIEYWQGLANAIRNAGKEIQKTEAIWSDTPSTINELNDNIAILKKELDGLDITNIGRASEINAQISAYQEQIEAVRTAGIEAKKTDDNFTWHDAPKTLQEINDNIAKLQNDLLSVNSIDEAAGINRQIETLEKLGDAYRNAGKNGESAFETIRKGYGNIKSIGSGVETLSDALEGNGNAWQTLTGIVDGFLQIYDGISAIVGIIDMLTMSSETLTLSKGGEAAATTVETQALNENTVATLTNTAAKSGESIAEAVKSGAKLPFPANIAAIAAGVAAVVGALSMIGSFATGGIVGGTSTTGDKLLARVNSGEMILNMSQQRRLFGMLNSTSPIRGVGIEAPRIIQPVINHTEGRVETGMGHVEFEIRGDRLYGVLRRYERMRDRT